MTRLLIVDDNDDNRNIRSRRLRRRDDDVGCAEDGPGALDAGEAYDAILLDVFAFDRSEPRLGAAGMEVRARLGHDPQPADIAVDGQDK